FNSPPLSRDDLRMNIENLPAPAWFLFNMQKYFDIGLFYSTRTNAKRILPLLTTRGCPEQCIYCTSPNTFGKRIRLRNPQNIGQEIRGYIQHFGGIDEVQIMDDNITANLTNLYAICDELKDLNIPWVTPNGIKANYHMERQLEYFQRMKDSGCYQVTIACETGNQDIMNNILKKRLKLHEMVTAVHNAKAVGLFVHTFWMVGFPGESRDDMERSLAFAAAVQADSYSVSVVNPLPGTKLYHKVVKEDLFWPQIKGLSNMSTKASCIKVDGFDNPQEFESWVNLQNLRLNELLGKRDPERFLAYENLRNVRLRGTFIKQT
ncbi:MAG: radical SAM protein, partial [Defluviitaleaceae bacterium]|nr:radical SAM protein [Defluviitaleaceae bacterium]